MKLIEKVGLLEWSRLKDKSKWSCFEEWFIDFYLWKCLLLDLGVKL